MVLQVSASFVQRNDDGPRQDHQQRIGLSALVDIVENIGPDDEGDDATAPSK